MQISVEIAVAAATAAAAAAVAAAAAAAAAADRHELPLPLIHAARAGGAASLVVHHDAANDSRARQRRSHQQAYAMLHLLQCPRRNNDRARDVWSGPWRNVRGSGRSCSGRRSLPAVAASAAVEGARVLGIVAKAAESFQVAVGVFAAQRYWQLMVHQGLAGVTLAHAAVDGCAAARAFPALALEDLLFLRVGQVSVPWWHAGGLTLPPQSVR